MNGKYYIGRKALTLTQYEKAQEITGVILWVDDENYYQAGDDTGIVIEEDCPYASQTMANNLLAELSGYQYQPLSATGAKITPIVELGDGITIGGLYTQLAYQNIKFSSGEVADIAAPGSAETPHEYKTEGETTREFNHKIVETRSLIAKTSEEILLQVSSEIDDLSSSISIQLDSITGRIDGLDGEFAEVSLTLDGLTITDSSGTTRIKGSSIDTSTLNANSITADKLNLTGAITFGDLDSDTQTQITNAQNTASAAAGSAGAANSTINSWRYYGSTTINGAMIQSNTVRASTLEGGAVGLLNAAGSTTGLLTMTGADTASYAVDLTSYGALRLTANSGSAFIMGGSGAFLDLSYFISCGADIAPSGAGGSNCGTSARPWGNVYAQNAEIQTSDENLKNSIESLPDKYLDMMDNVTPVRYKLNDGESGRYHVGFIAQDVERAMLLAGINSTEFGGWVKALDEEGNDIYMLRYSEFIAILWAKIKKIESRIEKLEAAA